MSLTPQQEIAKRLAEAGGGLAAAGRAVGLQDHQRLLRDNARRVNDSHRAMAKAAGMGEVLGKAQQEEGDDLGDILVTGDITINGGGDSQDATKLLEVLKGKAVNQVSGAESEDKPSPLGTIGKYAALAALVAGSGAGGAGLAAYFLQQAPQVVQQGKQYLNGGETFDVK